MAISTENLLTITAEDAYAFLAKLIHEHLKADSIGQLSYNGFDVYLPTVIDKYLPQGVSAHSRGLGTITGKPKEAVYRAFFDAAWQMCLSGLLRPSSAKDPNNGQQMGHGDCYSITGIGSEWFTKGDVDSIVLSAGRMAQLLNAFSARFGEAYKERAQQAVLCLNARAFLACCAMCGAAAESILLTAAIEKEKDEDGVLAKYKGPYGRSNIEKMIFENRKESFVSRFKSGLELLKYWRDESSHGAATDLEDIDATASLSHLLRFAQQCDDKWAELTT